jgi:hypothetical protein
MIRTVPQALALLRREQVLSMARLVEAIAGEPVHGSWWGHAKGKLIYNISSSVEDSGEALAIKAPRVTYVHRVLWPAFLRVVSDGTFSVPRVTALDRTAAKLISRMNDEREVQNPERKPREAIERKLLAHTASLHTEGGKHVTVMRPWQRWAADVMTADEQAQTGALTYDRARALLAAHGLKV